MSERVDYAQQDKDNLERVLRTLRKWFPDGHDAKFDVSDQTRGQGFVLMDVRDREGNSLMAGMPQENINKVYDEVDDYLYIYWDSVMGEDKHGYSTHLLP